MNKIINTLCAELNRPANHIENIIRLLDEGNTIPFIARYRKEMHGAMDDTTMRKLETRLRYLRNLSARKEEVIRGIDSQGKLTDELHKAVEEAVTLSEVEDVYRPYKPKRRTRATVAKEKGLEPLAFMIFAQDKSGAEIKDLAASLIDPEKEVNSIGEALAGASDIIAEMISDNADIRKDLRETLYKKGTIKAEAAREEDSVYSGYYDFSQPLAKMSGHQVLALNRGEKEGFLKVAVDMEKETALDVINKRIIKRNSTTEVFIRHASEDGYERLLQPSVTNEIRSELTAKAAEGAIHNFALNLKPLLMQPPVKGKIIMDLIRDTEWGAKSRLSMRPERFWIQRLFIRQSAKAKKMKRSPCCRKC